MTQNTSIKFFNTPDIVSKFIGKYFKIFEKQHLESME
jgi:hypothetical protein